MNLTISRKTSIVLRTTVAAFWMSSLSAVFAEGLPEGYLTGKWPVHPEGMTPIEKTNILLDSEPVVTMLDTWKFKIDFTTYIPTRPATVFIGVYDLPVSYTGESINAYDPGAVLPWPRYATGFKEASDVETTQHSVTLDLTMLPGTSRDITNLKAKGGGVMVYRIELYSPGTRIFDSAQARHYERRFEFYNGKLVPTVSEGPFVDQITDNSAILSWDTDKTVTGVVKVRNETGSFSRDYPTAGESGTHFEVSLTELNPSDFYYYRVEVTDGTDTTSTPEYYFRTPAAETKQFVFATLGDSREGVGGGDMGFNGVNSLVLKRLVAYAFNKGAEFIVHTGDFANGYTSIPKELELQLSSYKDVVEPVGHYLPIYEMPGNHEAVVTVYDNSVLKEPAHYGFLMFDQEGENSAEYIFAKEFVNPTNGPDPDNVAAGAPEGKSLPPYKENVYYFDYGNSRFVMLNCNYWYTEVAEKYGGNLEGYVLDDQFKWALDVFADAKANDKIQNVFLLAQEPFFPVGGQSNNAMWYHGGDVEKNHGFDRHYIPERRDAIWNAFLDTGKAAVSNFGDEHNYSRTLITKDRNGNDYAYPVWQIITGGAGAPQAKTELGLPWSDNMVVSTAQTHYALYKVDGKRVSIEVYNVDNMLIDSAELTWDSSSLMASTPVIDTSNSTRSGGLELDNLGTQENLSEAVFEVSVKPTSGDQLMSGKDFTVNFTVLSAPAEVGQSVELMMLLEAAGQYYMLTKQGWESWDTDFTKLEAFDSISALPNVWKANTHLVLPSGDYVLYVGYRKPDGGIVYNGEEPLSFAVEKSSATVEKTPTAGESTSSLESDVKQLLTQEEIGDLISQYAYAADGKDVDQISNLFTADATWEWSESGNATPLVKAQGTEAIKDYFTTRFNETAGTRHFQLSTVFTEMTEDVVRTQTVLLGTEAKDKQVLVTLTGLYEDEFKKTTEGWKFSQRTLKTDNSTPTT